MHQAEERRIIRLGGTRNLRDVGGYPTLDGRQTRWRTLYRSDCLDRLDTAGRTWLLEHGLRSIIDVRNPDELIERPNVFATSNRVLYQHFPFWEGPPPADLQPDLTRGYRREVDMLGPRLARLVELVAEDGMLPTLLHCAAGKDRTGLAVAVLLAAVGTRHDAIAEDYALSQMCLGPDYVGEVREWVAGLGYEWSVWEHTVSTPPERMLDTLAYLEEQHGGVEAYLLDYGVRPTSLQRLRELLTEPVAEGGPA
jgi:protein-tyrosine phosphatase